MEKPHPWIGKLVMANHNIGYAYDEFDYDEEYVERGEIGEIKDVFIHDDDTIALDVQFPFDRNIVYGDLGIDFTPWAGAAKL